MLPFSGACAYLQSNSFLGYAGLVASFTCPIITVGWNWAGCETGEATCALHGGGAGEANWGYIERATARMSQSATAVCVLLAVSVLVPHHAANELKARLRGCLFGLNSAIRSLPWVKPPNISSTDVELKTATGTTASSPLLDVREQLRWGRQARGLRGSFEEIKALVDEAHGEPVWLPTVPYHVRNFPQNDYHNAVGTLQELWGCVLQMHTCTACLTGQPLLSGLLNEYRHYAEVLLRHSMSCISHSADILAIGDSDLPRVSSVLPTALFQLYADSQVFLRAVDTVWDRYVNPRRTELRLAIEEQVTATLDFLAIAALLSQLRVLSNHTSSLAWRMAHILQKEQPGRLLLPEPNDLYDKDIET